MAHILPAGMAAGGIGIPGIALIRSYPATESFSIRSAGAFTPHGLRLALRTSGSATATWVAAITITSGQATLPALLLPTLPASRPTPIASVAADSAPVAVSLAEPVSAVASPVAAVSMVAGAADAADNLTR